MKKEIWAAINDYVRACGGDPDAYVYGNTTRQKAVVSVENAMGDMRELLRVALSGQDILTDRDWCNRAQRAVYGGRGGDQL